MARVLILPSTEGLPFSLQEALDVVQCHVLVPPRYIKVYSVGWLVEYYLRGRRFTDSAAYLRTYLELGPETELAFNEICDRTDMFLIQARAYLAQKAEEKKIVDEREAEIEKRRQQAQATVAGGI